MPQSTVYVSQRPKANAVGWTPDLTPALKYGKCEFVFEPDEQVSSDPNTMMRVARDRLDAFNPHTDYLLWPNTGDPAAIWACVMVLMGYGFTEIRFLLWDRMVGEDGKRNGSKGEYVPLTLRTDS